MSRLRVVGFVIAPQLMVDDGENLQPLQVEPLQVAAAQWPNVVDLMAGAIEELRQRVDGPAVQVVPEASTG